MFEFPRYTEQKEEKFNDAVPVLEFIGTTI